LNAAHPFAPRLPAHPRQGPAGLRCTRPASPSAVRRSSLVRPRCVRPTYATHISKTSTRASSQCRIVRDCSRVRRTVCFTSPGSLRRPSFRRTQRCLLGAPGMSLARSFELTNDRPPTRLWHPCRLPPAIAFELTLVPPLTRGLGRVHRVSVKEPWLVRPEMPSILEKPFSGSASIPRLCRRGPLPGSHFALRGRPLRASRPSAHPAATGFAFGWQLPLADFCSCKEYGHTGERPIPASKRAREWLVSLRPASCPAEREQATRQTEPKPRRRRSAAASTESTSSQRPRCGG